MSSIVDFVLNFKRHYSPVGTLYVAFYNCLVLAEPKLKEVNFMH